MRRIAKLLAGLSLLATAPATGAVAGEGPVTVELFTSQSCYSCPPAEAFLGELAGMPGVVALEFHVDYWDGLVYGSAGKWKDVFSSPAHTARQRAYNQRIRGRGSAYTPQMVIGGEFEAIGSHRQDVLGMIEGAREGEHLSVQVSAPAAGGLSIFVDGPVAGPSAIWLVRFERRRTTEIRAGENKGKMLVNHHTVEEVRRIGDWDGVATTLDFPGLELAPGKGCAVLVQGPAPGPILGAALCPVGGT
jgi:hypothetical protein